MTGFIRIRRGSTVAALCLLPFLSVTPAFAAGNVTLQDISFETGHVQYRIGKVYVLDTAADEREWAARFDKNSSKPLAERFVLPDAGRVIIPEVVIENPVIGSKVMLRDVMLNAIAGGRIGALSIAGASVTTKSKDPEIAIGPISATNLDPALAVRLAEGGGADGGERRWLFDALTFDTISVQVPDGAVKVDRITVADLRVNTGVFRNASGVATALGRVSVSGISGEVSDSSARGGILKWRIGGISLTADEPRNSIATRSRFALQGFSMDTDGDTPFNRELRDWGYDRFELSAAAEADWDEPAGELVVKDVTLDVTGAGSVTLQGKLGNVTKDMVTDPAAAERLSLKSFDLRVENKGLYERMIARDARRDKKSMEAVRADYIRLAGEALPDDFRNTPKGKLVADALMEFARKPGTLEISVSATDPAGMLIKDLDATVEGKNLDKFEVKAVAR